MCVLSIKVSKRKKSGNIFNDTRIYIYIYIYSEFLLNGILVNETSNDQLYNNHITFLNFSLSMQIYLKTLNTHKFRRQPETSLYNNYYTEV